MRFSQRTTRAETYTHFTLEIWMNRAIMRYRQEDLNESKNKSTLHPHGALQARRKADGSKKPREPKLSGFWCARRDLNPHVRSGH